MRCQMCQYRDWFERNDPQALMQGELTTADWKNLVDQTAWFSLITFTGGEPWVRQDFMEVLTYASRKRRTHFITNGVLLDEERARRCAELAPRSAWGKGLVFAGFSLEGPPVLNDAIRGREGGFEEAMANIRRLVRHRGELGKRFPRIHVTSVIQEANVDALPELPALFADAGADVLNLTLEIRFASMEGIGEVDPDLLSERAPALPRIEPERLQGALEATQRAAEEAGIELRLPDMPVWDIVRYYDGGYDMGCFTCPSPWNAFRVNWRGQASPCALEEVGDVREYRLGKLWNNERMRAFRRRLMAGPPAVCQGCCELAHRTDCERYEG